MNSKKRILQIFLIIVGYIMTFLVLCFVGLLIIVGDLKDGLLVIYSVIISLILISARVLRILDDLEKRLEKIENVLNVLNKKWEQ